MTERRYDEDEVRAIFDAASKSVVRRRDHDSATDGLSLTDLKRIGEEVGLPPGSVEAAARELDHAPSGAAVVRDFGLPIGVGRTVDLPREPTDREWERIVALARRTFDAKGKLDAEGRYWWNGNLSVSVEPTLDGVQLRLRTTKGDARGLNRAGLAAVALGLGSWAVTALMGLPPEAGLIPPIAAGWGVVALAANAFRLPAWSRRRSEQMELVARGAVDAIRDADDPAASEPG